MDELVLEYSVDAAKKEERSHRELFEIDFSARFRRRRRRRRRREHVAQFFRNHPFVRVGQLEQAGYHG